MGYWYYATRVDFAAVVGHLLDDGWELYEGYSRPDATIRRIASRDDVPEIEWIGEPGIHGWCPKVTNAPIFETLRLDPSVGAWRTRLDGPGIFRFRGGCIMDNGCLWPASFSHWNESPLRKGRSRGVFGGNARRGRLAGTPTGRAATAQKARKNGLCHAR